MMTDTDTITLTRQEYQELIDARDHAVAMREITAGRLETLGEDEAAAYLTAPSPLAFWRRKRGLSQTALAERVEITQPYLAQIETGKRIGDIRLYARLARALGLHIEDLVPED